MQWTPLTSLALTPLLLAGLPIQPPESSIPFPAPATAQTIPDPKAEADRLFQQGTVQFQRSQFQEALQSWQQSLQLYHQLSNQRGKANSLGNLGKAYSSLGDYRKAIDFHQQCLTLSREIGYEQGEVASLNGIGNTYFSMRNYPQAIEFHQQSLNISRQINNQQGIAASLGNLGNTYFSMRNYPQAIEFHQQSLNISRQINNQQQVAISLNTLGTLYRNLGNYPQAIEFHQQSLTLSRRINNQWEVSNSLSKLGFVYFLLGDYPQAIEFYQQSLSVSRKIGNQREEAISLGGLGLIYDSLGNYRQAIEFHNQHLNIARAMGDRPEEGAALNNLGLVYRNLGNHHKAIEFHKQALTIKHAIGDRHGKAASLNNLGNAYNSLEDYSQAIDFYQQSLTLKRAIGDRHGEARSLGGLGNAYYSLRDYRKASEFHKQHLEIARAIADRLGETQSLTNLGLTYDFLGDYRKAIESHQQSLAISREIGTRMGEAMSLSNLGLAFLHNNHLNEASHNLHQSIQLIETLWQELGPHPHQKISFLEQSSKTYRLLQRVLLLQDQPYRTLEIAERGRTRNLVEQMARSLQGQQITSPTLEDIKRLATEQNATLVTYSILPAYSTLLAWVIQPNGQVDFRAIDLDAGDGSLADLVKLTRRTAEKLRGDSRLTTLVRSSRQIVESGHAASSPTANPLRQLHQILIRPIADLLPPPESHIIFIPHRELFLVPFAALKDKQQRYLIEKYAISTAPSLQALALAQQHRERVQGKTEIALVVGNPELPKQLPEGVKSLETLPDAEEEARLIATHFNTQPLLRAAATETAVVKQLHQARIIHLATHGLALDPPNSFDLSGRIALAPSETDDGWLTATELVELTENNPLNAEMVVLSACDTGLGRITGDGILGLSHALIVSGVPSIVVSLWQVPDDSAQFLMERFYAALETSDNRAQALRQAMLQTLEVHEGPADWAAFTLVGTAQQ